MGNSLYIKQHGSNLIKDWIRVSLLYNITRETKSWRTPFPIKADIHTRCIAYERLDHCKPLHSLGRKKFIAVFRVIGERLFDLHSASIRRAWIYKYGSAGEFPLATLGVPEKNVKILERHLPRGLLHGDCWYGNILLDPNENLVLMDPLPNKDVVGMDYLTANGVIDIAMLYMSLFICHPLLKQIQPISEAAIEAGANLIDGYLHGIQNQEVRKAVMQVSRILALRYIDAYGMRLPSCLAVVKRFAGRSILKNLDRRLDWQ